MMRTPNLPVGTIHGMRETRDLSSVKVNGSYIARYPAMERFKALSSSRLGKPFHFNTISTSLGGGKAKRKKERKGMFLYSAAAIARRLFVHISTTVCIARYSFIQLSELWQRGVIKLAKGSKRPQWNLKPDPPD